MKNVNITLSLDQYKTLVTLIHEELTNIDAELDAIKKLYSNHNHVSKTSELETFRYKLAALSSTIYEQCE